MLHFVLLSLLVQPAAGIFPHLPKGQQLPSLPTRQFAYDMRTKNIDDVLTLYTPDAVFTDPAGRTFGSPQALRSLYEDVFATYDAELEFTRVAIKVKGDASAAGTTAVETDAYHENLRTRKTSLVAEHCGEVTSTWVRQDDGRWIMSRQAWTESSCPVKPLQ